MVRAPPCHGGSCGFESRQSRFHQWGAQITFASPHRRGRCLSREGEINQLDKIRIRSIPILFSCFSIASLSLSLSRVTEGVASRDQRSREAGFSSPKVALLFTKGVASRKRETEGVAFCCASEKREKRITRGLSLCERATHQRFRITKGEARFSLHHR